MNTETLTYLLEHPDKITSEETTQLRTVVEEFPFFQAARALHLKGLKNEDSFLYNTYLKKRQHTPKIAPSFLILSLQKFSTRPR